MNTLGYPDKVLGEGNKQAAFTFFYSAQLFLQESRDLEIPEHNGLNSAWDVFFLYPEKPSLLLSKFAPFNNVQYAHSEAEILFGA